MIVEENKSSIKLVESIGMRLEHIREDGYKIGDKYYNQKIYKMINKNWLWIEDDSVIIKNKIESMQLINELGLNKFSE